MAKKNKNKKDWYLILAVLGLIYLAWSVYQLINVSTSACPAGATTVLKPTLVAICNPTNIFFIPFGLVIGLIMMIVGIYYYSKKN